MKLGDVSLLAGMLTGEGATGRLMREGLGGAIPSAIARNAYAEEEKERAKRESAEGKEREDQEEPKAMKRGGKVSSRRRGDGIAQRGKTKGRMV